MSCRPEEDKSSIINFRQNATASRLELLSQITPGRRTKAEEKLKSDVNKAAQLIVECISASQAVQIIPSAYSRYGSRLRYLERVL